MVIDGSTIAFGILLYFIDTVSIFQQRDDNDGITNPTKNVLIIHYKFEGVLTIRHSRQYVDLMERTGK